MSGRPVRRRVLADIARAGGWRAILVVVPHDPKHEEPVRQRRERRTEKVCQALTQDGSRERS